MLHENDAKHGATTTKLPRLSIGAGDLRACSPGLRRRIIPALALGAALLLSLTVRPALAACPAPAMVTQEVQLNNAIEVFNALTEPCAVVIELGANIFLGPDRTSIDNPMAGVSLTIEGQGWTVDGNGIRQTRPFQINAGTTVTMNDITVTGGNVTEDTGADPFFRGGGILNLGTLTLNRSTVTNNRVDRIGGGISNHDTLTIIDSTISGNTVTGYSRDGKVNGVGEGGGIDSRSSTNSTTLTIRNSTVSGNQAPTFGAGLYLGRGTYTLDSVTITENGFTQGAGIWINGAEAGTLTIGNTIVNGNFFDFENCRIAPGGMVNVVDQGHNFFGPGSCGLVNGVNDNIVGPKARLLPLADNGGPTMTHEPKLDSPALDAGSTTLTTDQTGQARPIGPADDIGAFESTRCAGNTWTVDDKSTLNTAIACFNAKTDPGTYTISLANSIGTAPSPTTIDNANAGVQLVISGNGMAFDSGQIIAARALVVAANTTVTVNQLSMSGGLISGLGGAIVNGGTLNLNDCSIDSGKATEGGGGIYNTGTLVIDRCSIWNNEVNGDSTRPGGGIYSTGHLTIRNSTISGNKTSGPGGGIAALGAALDLDSVTVYNNTAFNSFGSGVTWLGTGSLFSVRNSIIAGNKGGAPDCGASNAPITNDGHNLVQLPGNCGFVNGVNGDIVGQDPLLSSLGNHGGTTRNHALLAGSPALDHGATSLTVDQRGFTRPVGAAADIGAFEEQQNGKITVQHGAQPQSNILFDYEVSGHGMSLPFQLNDIDPAVHAVDLPAGSYTVSVFPSNTGDRWAVVSIDCGGAPGVVTSVPDGTAVVPLAAFQQVTCSFEVVSRTKVTASVIGGNGSVSCSPPTYVLPGGDSHCTAVPDPGYQVAGWTGDCALAGSSAQCGLTNIQANKSSTVSFQLIPPITYTVTASVVGGHGTVSCAPGVVVKGDSSNCTAVPEIGYRVAGWSGDCAATGTNVQCHLAKVLKNSSSTVSFAAIPPGTFTVTATVGVGVGSAGCSPTSVAAGGSSTCTADPGPGFTFAGWAGACAGAGAVCNLTSIQEPKQSTASFAASLVNSVSVSALVGAGHGSVSCTPPSVGLGGTITCTAVPDPDHRIAGWTGACAFAGNSPQCVLTNLIENETISVLFVSLTAPAPMLSSWGLVVSVLLLLGLAALRLRVSAASRRIA